MTYTEFWNITEFYVFGKRENEWLTCPWVGFIGGSSFDDRQELVTVSDGEVLPKYWQSII